MLLEYACAQRKIREHVQIDFYTPEPGPMPVTGEKMSNQVRQLMESKGIVYHSGHSIVSVNNELKQIIFQNGAAVPYDLLIYVPPHKAPKCVLTGGLVDDSGWIPVDRHTMATRFPRIFAIGDINSIPLVMGKPLPKAGVFAHAQAKAVAQKITHEISGNGEELPFNGYGKCTLEIGGDLAGVGAGDFYAEPLPLVVLHEPNQAHHEGKVNYEKFWLSEWFESK